jgi:DeoR family suf operon transcriptional repressor
MAQPVASVLEELPATRRSIVLTLKKVGEADVGRLAREAAVSPSAVRQHLGALVGAGLVSHRAVASGRGRPRHVYVLTPAAEALFPKFYGELATELLGYVGDEDPGMVERIFERRRARRTERARARLEGHAFDQRVRELARILDEDGYLADVSAESDGSFLVTEHNCAILGVAERYGMACSTELAFLREVLPDAEVERVAHKMAGAHVCAYRVAAR